MFWSSKRQLTIILSIVALFLLLAAYPVYKALNVPPTCYDGLQNQNEVGVDCGGTCPLLCKVQVQDPKVLLVRSFQTAAGTYDVIATVENPNFHAETKNIGYTFTLFDAEGATLGERRGSTYLHPRDKFTIFESDITVPPGKTVASTTFAFGDKARWMTGLEQDVPVMIKDKKLVNTNEAPRLSATIANQSLYAVSGIDIVALVYDTTNKIVGASATYDDTLEGEMSDEVSFSWQKPFIPPPTEECTVPVDAMLVFDRSGSMRSDGGDPPQPISNAKDAALAFTDGMQKEDRIGLVSFATTPSIPVDQVLTFDHEAVKQAISSIHILSGGTQYTDLGDAVKSAYDTFAASGLGDPGRKPKEAIIVLTDGRASAPTNPADPADELYPEKYATKVISDIRHKSDISIYAIGLGGEVNDEFLKTRVATSPKYYYKAASSEELKNIYQQIASSVCKEGVYITDISLHAKSVSSPNQ